MESLDTQINTYAKKSINNSFINRTSVKLYLHDILF